MCCNSGASQNNKEREERKGSLGQTPVMAIQRDPRLGQYACYGDLKDTEGPTGQCHGNTSKGTRGKGRRLVYIKDKGNAARANACDGDYKGHIKRPAVRADACYGDTESSRG